jgi:hypothetical protein
MNTKGGISRTEPSQEELNVYIGLSAKDVARIVLCLLIEEALERQLASFRSYPKNLLPDPVEGSKELLV